MLMSWMATDWLLYQMLPTKQERIKALFFVLTSYVTMVFQAHTFSNSLETVLVLAVVYLINELRFLQTVALDQYSARDVAWIGLAIGSISAFGIFNRVTFPAFIIVPGLFLIPAMLKWKYLLPCLVVSFAIAATTFVVVDTAYYRQLSVKEILESLFCIAVSLCLKLSLSFLFSPTSAPNLVLSDFVVTPWNNLRYNSQIANLSAHGLHPYYTHILANMPQILGPGLVFLFGNGVNKYWKTTPFLAAAGGIAILSVIPHQELRFLIPTVPLLCACFDVTVFDSFPETKMNLVNILLSLWLVFNGILAVIMGIFHQGGVVLAMEYFYTSDTLSQGPTSMIWWRTYLAPTWMLGDTKSCAQFISLSAESHDFDFESNKSIRLVDAKGMPHEKLQLVLSTTTKSLSTVYLVTPVASFNKFFNKSDYEVVWTYLYHLPLDHFDFTDLASLTPGLGIYKLIL